MRLANKITFLQSIIAVTALFALVGTILIQIESGRVREISHNLAETSLAAAVVLEHEYHLRTSTNSFGSLRNNWLNAYQELKDHAEELDTHLRNDGSPAIQENLRNTISAWTQYQQKTTRLQTELSRMPDGIQQGIVPAIAAEIATDGNPRRLQTLLTLLDESQPAFQNLLVALDEAESAIALQSSQQYLQRLPLIFAIIAGVLLLYTIIAGFFARSLQRRLKLLLRDLENCTEMRNQITLPSRRGDELDMMISSSREWIRNYQEQLFQCRTFHSEHEEAQVQYRSAIRNMQNALSDFSGKAHKITGRLSSLEQLLGNAAENIGVLQLKTRRLREQSEAQSAKSTETSVSIKNISESITTFSSRAVERRDQALQMKQATHEGEQHIVDTQSDIQTIAEEIRGVRNILQTINNISEQTSLLSLNAFVESARGGENNKGFEVVANEIRQLADSTAENTAAISSLLHKIDDRVREAQFFSKKAFHTFATALEAVSQFAESMETIAEQMESANQFCLELVENAQGIQSKAETIRLSSSNADIQTNSGKKQIAETQEKTAQLLEAVKMISSASQGLEKWTRGIQSSANDADSLTRNLHDIFG